MQSKVTIYKNIPISFNIRRDLAAVSSSSLVSPRRRLFAGNSRKQEEYLRAENIR